MKKKFYLLLSVVMLASLVLSACGGQTAPVVEEEPEPTEVMEEPTEAPEPTEAMEEEASAAGPEGLDPVFNAMLTEMQAYDTIKMDGLLTEMAEDAPPFILDVRTQAEVEENGHIEGAAHIPLSELAQHIGELPAVDTPIVTYCAGGWRATIAMTALQGMGFEDVRALKATFADWVDAGNPVVDGVPEDVMLDAAELDPALVKAADAYLVGIKDHGSKYGIISADALNVALGEQEDLVVIDVRRQEEVDSQGVIDAPNFLHIPLEEFVDRRAEWPGQDVPISIYCGSGHRSTMAMTIMFAYGYDEVTSLSGGFKGWVDAGYATVGGSVSLDDTYSAMLETMEAYNTVKSADVVLTEMMEDQPPFVLDVRTLAEVEESGYIEGAAAHIPLSELAKNIDQLPSFDTPIITYCAGGWRATIAMTALHAMGWEDVRALKVGFADWVEGGNPVADGVPEAVSLDAAQPEANLVQAVDSALSGIREMGYGVIKADALNTALLENPDLILIDDRTMPELEEKGVIAVEDQELLTIPLQEFIDRKGDWPADKDAEIVVYCGSGHRSTMGMTILLTYGYSDVSSLSGGFGGWMEAGYPVAEYAAP
jgi:rhodanese-related sulfurtransferase